MNVRLLNAQPWRFAIGQRCYVRGWHQARTVEILDIAPGVLPTYLCLDELGATWRIAQIELSSRPIAPDA